MTNCAGKYIKEIKVTVLSSPSPSSVFCHSQWYEFVRKEAYSVLAEELNSPKAKLEKGNDLKDYVEQTRAPLHAEVRIVKWRMSKGLKNGEIGVSKNCCSTCLSGISSLGDIGYNYIIKSGHCKPHMASLPGNYTMDTAVISRIKKDFANWIRRIHVRGDSDVSMDEDDTAGELKNVEKQEVRTRVGPILTDAELHHDESEFAYE
jgi:hypothetical protein